MTTESVFMPILTIDDDGRVDIVFDDSFYETVDENGRTLDGSESHIDAMDAILGIGTSSVERLRRLADYIEAQETS